MCSRIRLARYQGVRTTVFEEIGYGLENLGVDPDTMEEQLWPLPRDGYCWTAFKESV